MKKITILLLALILISCSKDESVSEPDYSYFLKSKERKFNFKTTSTNYNWRFGINEFQMSTGYSPLGNNQAVSMFGLISDEGINYFNLITPAVDTSNLMAVENVFSLGKKKFGEQNKFFNLTITINNLKYVNNLNDDFELEILKTEEFLNYDNKVKLLVWIKIDYLVLENIDQNGDTLEIKNGFMIAEFDNF